MMIKARATSGIIQSSVLPVMCTGYRIRGYTAGIIVHIRGDVPGPQQPAIKEKRRLIALQVFEEGHKLLLDR
jgi:hypothetical protein